MANPSYPLGPTPSPKRRKQILPNKYTNTRKKDNYKLKFTKLSIINKKETVQIRVWAWKSLKGICPFELYYSRTLYFNRKIIYSRKKETIQNLNKKKLKKIYEERVFSVFQ